MSNNLQYTARQLSKDLSAVLYLEKNLSSTDINRIKSKLEKSSSVTKIQFTTSDQALQKFRQKFPQLEGIIDNLNINPFPASFEISIKEKDLSPEEIRAFLQEVKRTKGIEDVQFNQDLIEKMQSLSRLVKAVGGFLGGILILASFFIISNVIKLNVFSRREEIEILRLVGATNSFIRLPFLLEGIILGIIGVLFSFFLLFLVIKIFPLYVGTPLGVLQELINFRYLSWTQSLLLIAGGAFIGFFGSMSSLARFLKI